MSHAPRRRPVDDVPHHGVGSGRLTGKPTLHGDTLYIADRFTGRIDTLDVTDLARPKLVNTTELPGNPGLVLEHKGAPVIPAGYQGLLVGKERSGR